MRKIGRNDSCSCGSGKKFKKCCMITSEHPPVSRFSEYISTHESGHILSLITAMQLFPQNHGKNVRIELIAKEVLKNLHTGRRHDYNKLRSIILGEFPSHHFEDSPEGLYTENVIFHGGNYVVMPGINSNAVDIFKYLSEAIYFSGSNFTEEFKFEVQNGISFLLEIGKILFDQAQLKRNLVSAKASESLVLPSQIIRLCFSHEEIISICNEHDLPPSIVDQFITDPSEPLLDDMERSPLLYKPFVIFNNEIHMLLPTCQMLTINEYIIRTAKKHKTHVELHTLLHQRIWRDIWGACDNMGWILTDISLPVCNTQLPILEGVFHIDKSILAYVCYSYKQELDCICDEILEKTGDIFGSKSLNDRIKEVINDLKSRKDFDGFQFMTLFLFNSMGGFYLFNLEKPQKNEFRTWFNVFDFINLAYADEWGRLDLLKYSKVYEYTSKNATIHATSSVDRYSTYKKNGESFYLSDKARPDFINIVSGEGADLIRDAKTKLDVHGALYGFDRLIAYKSVKRYRDFAPVYEPLTKSLPYEVLLESYKFPIWIRNFQAKSKTETNIVELVGDAICYWLYKLYPALSSSFDQNTPLVLNIVLNFDSTFFDPIPIALLESNEQDSYIINSSFDKNDLSIYFPKNIQKLFFGKDNYGERVLMTEILKAFNLIPNMDFCDQFITNAIDEHMPLGLAKMILFFDTRINLQIDNRWILPSFYISDAEKNLLLDRLGSIIISPDQIPEKIISIEDKISFCNKVVLGLIQSLYLAVSDYNFESLIVRLLEVNERLIYDREYYEIKSTAQIHCFGNKNEVLELILDRERKLVNTSLSTRCLIEFIALNPTNGSIMPSFDQLDELLSIMNEILNFGMLSDTLFFGMDNHEIGMLPSGRIGISREFFDQKLQHFYKDNTIANIEAQLEAFPNYFEFFTNYNNSDKDVESFFKKVDEAFIKDWGISNTILNKLCIQAASIAERLNESVVLMQEKDLIEELKTLNQGCEDQVEKGLKKLSFECSPEIISPEEGYINPDYFPWKYNREFSFARRPFVVISTDEGRKFIWGMRQCFAAKSYLNQLLQSGALTHGGSEINRLLGHINSDNGKQFRNSVTQWIKSNTDLIVWDLEVTIKPGGHLDADKDYGDCDIFAYDESNNWVYNIECKRTIAARNIRQMKKELDAYFGRAGQRKKIAKHVERDTWLRINIEKVMTFIGTKKQPNVKSIILTSGILPTRYIKEGELPLPILSFRELKMHGKDGLLNC